MCKFTHKTKLGNSRAIYIFKSSDTITNRNDDLNKSSYALDQLKVSLFKTKLETISKDLK